jgi:hypothetical protein
MSEGRLIFCTGFDSGGLIVFPTPEEKILDLFGSLAVRGMLWLIKICSRIFDVIIGAAFYGSC